MHEAGFLHATLTAAFQAPQVSGETHLVSDLSVGGDIVAAGDVSAAALDATTGPNTLAGGLQVSGGQLRATAGASISGGQLSAAAGLDVIGLTSLQRTEVTHTAPAQHALTITSASVGIDQGALKVSHQGDRQLWLHCKCGKDENAC